MISNELDITPTTISLPPKTIVGYRENGKPIYNIAGGSGAVSAGTDGDDDESEEEESDDDSTEDEEDEYVPPSREAYERLLADKRKADSESAARKRLLRENGLDPKTGKPLKPKVALENLDDDDEDDDTGLSAEDEAKAARDAAKGVNRAKQEKSFQRQLEREVAKTERRVRDESTVLIAAIPTALQDEGWNGKNLTRLLKLMDMDNVSVDSDGEVDGLVEEIEELKKDFPEFFKRTRMKDAAKDIPDTKTVGGGSKTAASSDKDLSWTEQLKKNLYGKQ